MSKKQKKHKKQLVQLSLFSDIVPPTLILGNKTNTLTVHTNYINKKVKHGI